MKKLLLIAPVLLITACVPIRVTKNYEVHRGPNGVITETVETETSEQHGFTFFNGIQPEHLRYGKDDTDIVKVHY